MSTARFIVGDVFDVLASLEPGSVDLVMTSQPTLWYRGRVPKNLPIPGRWWEKVTVRGPDECWPWKAAHDKDGYGRFQTPKPDGGQRHIRAHRYGYELLVGGVPQGKQVLHRCDNPPCCNPKHWFLGSNQDNVDDRQAKGRGTPMWGMPLINARKTHCKRGHEFTPENTRRLRNGKHRRCKTCEPIDALIWYRRSHGLPLPEGVI